MQHNQSLRSILEKHGKSVNQIFVAKEGMDLAELAAWTVTCHDEMMDMLDTLVSLELVEMVVSPDNVVTPEMRRHGFVPMDEVDIDRRGEAFVALPIIFIKYE